MPWRRKSLVRALSAGAHGRKKRKKNRYFFHKPEKVIILGITPSKMPVTIRILLTVLLLTFLTIPALPATFYVTSNADNGTGTLRDALTQAAANGTTTTDYIFFNLADQSMGGRTIDLLTELPVLSSNLIIDGTTQPGTPFYTTDARIFIRMMTFAASFSMLKVYNCTAVQIYGLYLYYGDWQDAIFPTTNYRTNTLYGINISNSSNIIIGTPGKGNVLNGEATGIWSADNSNLTHDITIQSNYIGCGLYNSNGTNDVDDYIVQMNRAMYFQNVANITLGGTTSATGNVLCGQAALYISSSAPTGNGPLLIQNNSFARWFDKTTLLAGYDGNTQYVIIGQGNTLLDYALQLLDNDIPERVFINNLTPAFSIKRNTFGSAPDFAFVDDTKLLITYCSGGVIGGDDPADANKFLFGKHPGFSVHTSDVGPITSLKNMYECNSQYGSTTWTSYVYQYYQVPVAQVNQPSPTVVSGTATPNCRVDLYYDDECSACEGKIYIGQTASDANGNWTYGGSVNGTVIATATNSSGRTGDFSAPEFFTGNQKIIDPSCGNANGSITGITSDGAESFYWVDLTTGATVSNSIDLTNVGPDEYLLYGVHGGTCIKPIGQSITLSDVTPKIQAGNVVVTQPGCGQFNGSITNITVSEYSNLQFTWVNGQGQTVSTQQNLTNVGPGEYMLVVKDAVTGCSDQTGYYQLVNQAGPTVDISQVQITNSICLQPNGDIANVLVSNITGQPSYSWINASGQVVGTSLTLQNVPGGTYQLVFKDQGSCPSITTPDITIPNIGGNVQLDADQVAVTDESCERKNGSIQVQDITPAETGFSFVWIDNATGATIGSGTSISGLTAGDYYLQATDASGCPQKVASFHLSDDPAPTIDPAAAIVTPDTCSQGIGSITGITVQGTAPFTYAWYNTSGATIGAALDLSLLGKGSYYLVVDDKNNCLTTGPVMAVDNYDQQLTAPSYDDLVVPKGQTATISVKDHASGTYDLYATDPGGITTGSAPSPVQTNATGDFTTSPLDADTTVYVVLTKGDCSSTATAVNIKVLMTEELIIPNAFTPNGDGHNDVFRIKNPQLVQRFSMRIFDRWGQKVFETANAYQGWDGSRNSQPAPMGTYIWTISYTDILGGSHNRQGTVILIR
jgi:gliding motility-associated-like protein